MADYDPEVLLQQVAFEIAVTEEALSLAALGTFASRVEIATHVASAMIEAVFDTADSPVQEQGQRLAQSLGRNWSSWSLFAPLGDDVRIGHGGAVTDCLPHLILDRLEYASPFKIMGRAPLLIVAVAVAFGNGSFELDLSENELKIKAEFSGGVTRVTLDTEATLENPNRLNRLTIQSAERVSRGLKDLESNGPNGA